MGCRYCMLLLSLVLLSGCTVSSTYQAADVYLADQIIGENVKIVPQRNVGRVWLPLQTIANGLGLKVHQINGRCVIGATDPAYRLQAGRTDAFAGDRPITLSDPPRQFGNRLYITDRTLTDLWTLPVHWDEARRQISITPVDHEALALWLGSYNFRNSPTQMLNVHEEALPIVSTMAVLDPQELVRFALQYQAAPFRLDAESADQAATSFDSSSFIRFVFGHFGIHLPRTALSQAEMGVNVMNRELLPGDLLFFGQARGCRLVNHVGMYVGANRFIHTYGAPGVTLSDFGEEWRSRFLFAKRLR